MAPDESRNVRPRQSSVSSLVLPVPITSRRSSVGSSNSQTHKESVAQALDQIHSSASKSESLTTFNDFTSPPLSSSEKNETLSTVPTPSSGLGNIYNRFRASVAGAKEAPKSNQPESKTEESKIVGSVKQPTKRTPSSNTNHSDRTLTQASVASTSGSPRPSEQTTLGTASESSKVAPFGSHEIVDSKGSRSSQSNVAPSAAASEINKPSSPASLGVPTTSPLVRLPSAELEVFSSVGVETSKGSQTERPKSLDSRGRSIELSGASVQAVESGVPKGVSPSETALSALSRQSSAPGRRFPPINTPDRSSATGKSKASSEKSSSAVSSEALRSQSGVFNTKPRPVPHPQSNSLIYQMQRKVLSKEFWMKDENAKVCFNCGDSFTTFRRKHHCRLCGQIYCNSCTKLISGKPFGHASKLRVCRTCEVMLNEDDSSDYSDDDTSATAPLAKSIRFSETTKRGVGSPTRANRDKRLEEDRGSNSLGISLNSRRSRELRRTMTTGVEPTRQQVLARPSSSRSLKSLSNRPRSSSHKSSRSREHIRALSFMSYETPPFQSGLNGRESSDRSLPAFHTDSIIDPDLAPFMSDEESSDDAFSSISATLEQEPPSNSSPGFHSILGALRRGRPRTPAKAVVENNIPDKDADNASVSTPRTGYGRRHLGHRTMSMGTVTDFAASPHVIRSDNLLRSSDNLYALLSHPDTPERGRRSQFPKTESTDLPHIGGKNKTSSAELHPASLDHVKKLLCQFLRDAHVQHTKRWERALVPILLSCAAEVDPSIHRGDDIDIRHYVKLKKAPGGTPSDSKYVSGVVFSKNVALKDMPRTIRNPRILLVAFPLIYARHQDHLMSLEGVVAQEKEYLKNLSNRIIALKPSLVLVQGQVAGLVTEFLRDANIAVIYNVKSSVMFAASRCTRTKIVSSVEKLTMDPRSLGTCENFDVKTHVYQQSKIYYVYLSGCQKDLGCTIVLRGADRKTLSKVKWITEFMCYVAYNLKLETCLMRDQFISLPTASKAGKELVSGQTDHENTLQTDETKLSNQSASNETSKVEGDQKNNFQDALQAGKVALENSTAITKQDSPPIGSYDSTVRQLRYRLLSASPFVKLAEPYLLLRGQEQEILMARLRELQQTQDSQNANVSSNNDQEISGNFELVHPEMVYAAEQNTPPHVREILRAVHTSEYQKAAHNYAAIQRRWETYIAGVVEPYSPLTHQKIVTLFSINLTHSGDSCYGPDLLGLDFYQEHDIDEGCERDMPLGEYVERLCEQADLPCIAGSCERKMIEHYRQYVHGDGQLTVSVQKLASRYRNMENTILMWSCCRLCEQETQVVPMSSDSWKYSFAKYLELAFWSSSLHPRAGTCPHDVHRDHLRYFGFKNLAIRVQYDPIKLVEITLPRGTVTWAVDKDLRLKNSQYKRIEERIERFLSSVKTRLKNIKLSSIEAEKREACKKEIDDLLQRANEQHSTLIASLQHQYMSAKFYEIIPLNKALRELQEEVAEWDSIFADFEKNYFPSEKDLRKLAATQLRRAYLGQDEVVSVNMEDEANLDEKASGRDTKSVGSNRDSRSRPSSRDGQERISFELEGAEQSGGPKILGTDGRPSTPLSPENAQIVSKFDLAVPDALPEMSSSVQEPSERLHESQSAQIDVPIIKEPAAAEVDAAHTDDNTAMQADMASKGRPQEESPSPAANRRLRRSVMPPPIIRSHTQPVTLEKLRQNRSTDSGGETEGPPRPEPSTQHTHSKIPLVRTPKSPEKSSTHAIKGGKSAMQSMIPRAIRSKRHETKVSALAKHFEEMSREFERDRIRERLQRAARSREARAFPLASSKPIVEVFRDASEAVGEREPLDEEAGGRYTNTTSREPSILDLRKFPDEKQEEKSIADWNISQSIESLDKNKHKAEPSDENAMILSYPPSEAEGNLSDNEAASITTYESALGDGSDLSMIPSTGAPELPIEIAKEEKTSLMKMLMSFWSERSASGWSPLEYPLSTTAHIFSDSDLIVREDEPSSLIAFTLASHDYRGKIQKFWDRAQAAEKDGQTQKENGSIGSEDNDVERIMLGKTATHMKYTFQSGPARMQCKVFFAEAFDALRRKCGVADRFEESLSRCLKWDSKGGKTRSVFLKTHDERFVLKSLSPVETQAFLKFAPDYFDYMSRCLFHNMPSALAKMLGFYHIVIKDPVTGHEFNWFLQVMENVFYEGPSNRMFDLKGSMRNRKVQTTGEKDEVLLDENLLDYISQNPVYVRNHSNTVLASSIQNDTLFCSKQNVMDYSLIVGLYEDRKELLVGIIDYIRTYTWDKKLESWIKDRGKHKATVRSPKEYRTRFRRSIPRYFPLAPSCWQIFGLRRIEDAKARLEEFDVEEGEMETSEEVKSVEEGR